MAAILDPIASRNLQEFIASKMTRPAGLAQQKKRPGMVPGLVLCQLSRVGFYFSGASPAALRSLATMSVFSHVKSGWLLPKCPFRAVRWKMGRFSLR